MASKPSTTKAELYILMVCRGTTMTACCDNELPYPENLGTANGSFAYIDGLRSSLQKIHPHSDYKIFKLQEQKG